MYWKIIAIGGTRKQEEAVDNDGIEKEMGSNFAGIEKPDDASRKTVICLQARLKLYRLQKSKAEDWFPHADKTQERGTYCTQSNFQQLTIA